MLELVISAFRPTRAQDTPGSTSYTHDHPRQRSSPCTILAQNLSRRIRSSLTPHSTMFTRSSKFPLSMQPFLQSFIIVKKSWSCSSFGPPLCLISSSMWSIVSSCWRNDWCRPSRVSVSMEVAIGAFESTVEIHWEWLDWCVLKLSLLLAVKISRLRPYI